jgi:hypothetical protein
MIGRPPIRMPKKNGLRVVSEKKESSHYELISASFFKLYESFLGSRSLLIIL